MLEAKVKNYIDCIGKETFIISYCSWGHSLEEAEKEWDKMWEQFEVRKIIREKAYNQVPLVRVNNDKETI